MHEADGSRGMDMNRGRVLKAQGLLLVLEFEGDWGGQMSLVLRNWVQSTHVAFSSDHNYSVLA